MTRLSVIMPYVREYPQNMFTLMNVYEELRDRCDFEIITVDNFVPGQVKVDGKTVDNDRGWDAMHAASRCHKEIIALQYPDKLSHWNAKNYAVRHSTGEFLWFVDAHCVVARDALYKMFRIFESAFGYQPQGSIHLPLTYKIHEHKKLIYKLVNNQEKGELAYTFTSYRPSKYTFYEVPCMSMCGAMMTRKQYDDFGGWPSEMGIYSGGEHFFNFVSAILGYKKYIMVGYPLRHYGEKRGYSWNFVDFHRNRLIANYMFGGKEWLYRYAKKAKPSEADTKLFKRLADNLINTDSCKKHRELIKSRQVITIEDWIKQRE